MKVSRNNNLEKNFACLRDHIAEVKEKSGKTEIQIIDELVETLASGRDVEGINIINDKSGELRGDIISYFKKLKKHYEIIDRKEKEKEKRELNKVKSNELETRWIKYEEYLDELLIDAEPDSQITIVQDLITNIKQDESTDLNRKGKRFFVRKLEVRLQEIIKLQKNREEEEHKFEQAMGKIEEIAEREIEDDVDKKISYYETLKESIEGNNTVLKIKLGNEAKQKLLQRLDDRITLLGEEKYYNEVVGFTRDFQLPLNIEIEVINGSSGTTRIKAFSNYDNYLRYNSSIVEELRKYYYLSEDKAIEKLLKDGENADGKKLDETSRKILNSRMEVILEEKRKREELYCSTK